MEEARVWIRIDNIESRILRLKERIKVLEMECFLE